MHPILMRKERLALYLLAWLPIGVLFATTLRFFDDFSGPAATALSLPMALVLAFLCLAVWPLCRALPLGHANWARLIGAHAGSVVVLSGLWILSGRLISDFLARQGYFPDMSARFERVTPILIVMGLLVLALSIAVHYLLVASERARDAERTALEVQVQAREAELKALKAQINPHFLFNSLNSISALAGKDPAGARRMSILLSEFMRRSMRLGAHEQIALADELKLADDYLAIEQIRFGERLRVERDVEDAALTCRVPALMLQPVLENAIKHGIAHTVEGGLLQIAARRHAGRLEISVENPCDPERPPTRGQGLGIPNVRSRLANVHPAQSQVLTREQDGRFRITITMPAVEAPISDADSSSRLATRDEPQASARRTIEPSHGPEALQGGAEPHGV